jgi:hypothetical protein
MTLMVKIFATANYEPVNCLDSICEEGIDIAALNEKSLT